MVTIDEVLHHDANLNIPLYIRQQNGTNGTEKSLPQVIADWRRSSATLKESMDALFETLSDVQ